MVKKCYQGDDILFVVTVTKDGSPLAIDPGATVQAALVHVGTGAVVGPVACSSGHAEASWSTGVVAAVFPAASTGAAALGRSVLELEINDGGIQTCQVPDLVVLADHI